MGNGVRALVSAVLLAGFLLVAALQLCLVVVPVLVLLAVLPGSAATQVGVPLCIATVGVMAYATWQALRGRRGEPAGVPVSRTDAPDLWALIDDAARIAGTRPPGTVTVVAEAVATLDERTRLLGLVGGPRTLYLGLPLLQAWDVAHLRAAVAHEIAHTSPRLGRFAPLAYRGRVAVGRVVPRISRRNLAGPILLAYARLYRRIDAPFVRAQELAADGVAAQFAGARAAAAVPRDLPVLDAAQQLFYSEYVGPGWQAGHVPDDIFGGFLRVLAARADELAALRAREPVAGQPIWETHPPLADRLAARAALTAPPKPQPTVTAPTDVPTADLPTADPPAADAPAADLPEYVAPAGFASALGRPTMGMPIVSPSAPDEPEADQHSTADQHTAAPTTAAPTRPEPAARELVPDLPGLGHALQRIVFPPQGRTTVGWDTFFGAARTDEMQREADAVLGSLTRAAGTPVTSAGDVLDLAADGSLVKATETVFPGLPPDAVAERVAESVKLLVALAALRSGAARWRHSWTGTAELVAADGSQLDLGEVAALAATPGTVGAARDRATELGIDLLAAGQDDSTRTAARAEVVSGLVNLVVDGSRTDLLIVDTGLFLVPGLPRSQNGSAKRRLAHFAAADEPERQATVPGSRFVPYVEVAGAARIRRTPKTWDLSLRDGKTLTLRTALDSDELPGGWAALDDAVAFLSRSR